MLGKIMYLSYNLIVEKLLRGIFASVTFMNFESFLNVL